MVAVQDALSSYYIERKGGILLQDAIGAVQVLLNGLVFDGCRQLIESDTLGERERAAAGAYEASEMGTAAQAFAEVVGKGANVGAFTALDGEREFWGLPREYVELCEDDGTWLKRDFFTGTHTFVGGLTLQFDGGVKRRHLHLRSEKAGKCMLYLVKSEIFGAGGAHNGAFDVISIGDDAKEDVSLIGFAAFAEVFGDAGS